MAEHDPLLRNPNKRVSRFRYNFQQIKSKGAILVLVWDVLASFSVILMYHSVGSFVYTTQGNSIVLKIFENLFYALYFLYPLGGLIADVWTGRYKVIIVSAYICFFGWIICGIGYVTSSELHPSWTGVILCVSTLLYTIGMSGFRSVIIPFNIDQLMGSSSEELSATIYWHLFGMYCGRFTCIMTMWECSLTPQLIIGTHLPVVGFTIATILVSNYFLKGWLNTTPQIYTNPIKLIFKVLNYARKNSYPRNRSSLTYWQNNYPSRLDLGKEKYGGPFREDEVEGVKTVLRLLPMLICVIGHVIAWDSINFTSHLSRAAEKKESKFYWCFVKSQCINYNVLNICILLHQFVIYPCFSRYIPSMLKRICLGMSFTLISSISYLILVLIGYENKKSSGDCLLNSEVSDDAAIPINYQWVMIPQLICGLGFFFIHVSCFEFVIAQSPTNMRGFIVGIVYAAIGIGEVININFYYPFLYIHADPFGCIFYYFLAKSMLILLILVAFLCLAKHYKLRVRENIVPVYQIAEEYYERYMEQSENTENDSSEEITNYINVPQYIN